MAACIQQEGMDYGERTTVVKGTFSEQVRRIGDCFGGLSLLESLQVSHTHLVAPDKSLSRSPTTPTWLHQVGSDNVVIGSSDGGLVYLLVDRWCRLHL